MRLLILGGTTEAKVLARRLHNQSISVIYSIAGLVRQPDLDCRVVSGGFSQYGGLEAFVKNEAINAILDATHPFAMNMSNQAVTASNNIRIPCWRFLRPAWQATQDDDWKDVNYLRELIIPLSDRQFVFFAVGQLDKDFIDEVKTAARPRQKQLIRTAVKPSTKLPDSMTWLKAIGPFDLDSELALFRRYKIDALVCKNSGGDATSAKLVAARQLGIPVFMLKRPLLDAVEHEFDQIEHCVEFVLKQAA